METILIIDDEKDLVMIIKDSLENVGYSVSTAFNGKDGIVEAKKQPHLIILDVMMPDIDGYNVCKVIRDQVSCPILFLSARHNESDKIKGLAIGGDDYIVKPFGLKELIVRVEAHLRREKRSISLNQRSFLPFGNLKIDLKGRLVNINNENITLTKIEFDIVELLALHPGQIFSKEQIYEKIWGYDAVGDSSTVTEHIKKIRHKFSFIDSTTEYISTVWGIGYKWERIK